MFLYTDILILRHRASSAAHLINMSSVDENVALLSALGRPPYSRPSPPVSSSFCCFVTCFLTTLAVLLVGAMSYFMFHDMQATPSEDPLIHVHSAPLLA